MSAPSTAELAAHLVSTAGAAPEDSLLLAQLVADRLRWDGSGAPTVLDHRGMPALDANGAPVTPAALVGTFAREMPSLFKVASPVQPSTIGVRSGMTGLTAKAAAEHAAAARQSTTGEPANPWNKATHNLTHQVLMERNNPEMAARMKAEAGAA